MSSWDWLTEQIEKNPAAEAATPRYAGVLDELDGCVVVEATAFSGCHKLPPMRGHLLSGRTCLQVTLAIDDEDVDTAGGLLAKGLGQIPILGSETDILGLHLVAERFEGRRKRLATLIASLQQ